MSGNPERTFLVIARVDRKAGDPLAVALNGTLKKLASDGPELLFSTEFGDAYGIVLRSTLAAAQIRARLDGTLNLQNKDFVMVLSLDEDWAATGNSSGYRHLQRLMRSRMS